LYYFGNITPPPLPSPLVWSITRPGYTQTPEPMGADDWGGEAMLTEESGTGRPYRTQIFFSPSILKQRVIKAELHAHLSEPNKGPGSSRRSFNAAFRLINSSDYARGL